MLLSQLLKNANVVKMNFDMEVNDICVNSKNAMSNSVFFCLKGEKHNSEYHAKEAAEKGCAIVCENELDLPRNVVVDNIEFALSQCCSAFYGEPEKRIKLIGVTGTNGKTTVSYMIKHILEFSGYKTGIMGTLGNYCSDVQLDYSGLTTPEPKELYKILGSMAQCKTDYCVMEVSSQALSQGRCVLLDFCTSVFTNLTSEHLDYHKTMKNYADAKAKLFSKSKIAVLNYDDEYFHTMKNNSENVLTFSTVSHDADLFAYNIMQSAQGIKYSLKFNNGIYEISVPVTGVFNVYNSMCSIGCCLLQKIPVKKCIEALKSFNGVAGRGEMIKSAAPFNVVIDYAHTPDGLKNIINSVKQFTTGRVICLFGCGGNRDKSKRQMMGRISAEYADFTVITSDNPRYENPYNIINDILKGFNGFSAPFAVIENRKKAIYFAVEYAQPGDTVLLCGKGHEKYQTVGNKKICCDERKITAEIIEKLF